MKQKKIKMPKNENEDNFFGKAKKRIHKKKIQLMLKDFFLLRYTQNTWKLFNIANKHFPTRNQNKKNMFYFFLFINSENDVKLIPK